MGADVRYAATAMAALGYVITALGTCIVLLSDDFGVPPEQLAWLPATFGFGLLAMAPAGPVLLRDGPRRALAGGSLAIATGATLLAFAWVPAMAVAGGLLLGAGGAAFALVTPAMLAGARAAVQLTKVNAAASVASVLAPAAIGGLNATGVVNGRLALLLVVPPLLHLAATARPTAPEPRPQRIGRPAAGAAARRWGAVVLAVSVEFCFSIWAVTRLVAAGLTPGTAAVLGTMFPFGMALGRLAGPPLIGRIPVAQVAAAVTAAGALVVVVAGNAAVITVGLLVAGVGVAILYPVTLAGLIATPRLNATHAASLGALASGTAIIAAPAALARLAEVVDLRLAFLITLPLLAALLLLRYIDQVRGDNRGPEMGKETESRGGQRAVEGEEVVRSGPGFTTLE
ncbi:hypothetical protein Areg01_34460 [Actinoplanes regularis]|nr:hypothetical protein Areg01_34460 [Actinoplanes regularis]